MAEHSAQTKPTRQFREPWYKRRIVYSIVSAAAATVAAFGWIDPDTIDQTVTQVMLLISAVSGAWSATKTGPGSDSSSTNADVERASRGSITAEDLAALRGLSPTETAREVIRMIRAEERGEPVLDEDTAPATSVADYYKEQA
ncbi:hypothetical protein PQI66_00420 [Corynebacterium sp. USCH3]|uniref:hypothetical protein n=1 Tax=Corynebacterium sp. USCH3 TaxID=3024840 RepID=UPI0030B3B751